MSKIVFGFLLTAIAFIAFFINRLIEKRVNNDQSKLSKNRIILYSSSVEFILPIPNIIEPIKNLTLQKQSQVNHSEKICFVEIIIWKTNFSL